MIPKACGELLELSHQRLSRTFFKPHPLHLHFSPISFAGRRDETMDVKGGLFAARADGHSL